MAINVKEASKELDNKSLEDIQRETAWKWASRACAAYEKAWASKDFKEALQWTLDATEYKHEAIEHAALIEDGTKLLQEVLAAIASYEK